MWSQKNKTAVHPKNIKKVYPYIIDEQKKTKKKNDVPEKKIGPHIPDVGVLAVQEFNLDFPFVPQADIGVLSTAWTAPLCPAEATAISRTE